MFLAISLSANSDDIQTERKQRVCITHRVSHRTGQYSREMVKQHRECPIAVANFEKEGELYFPK